MRKFFTFSKYSKLVSLLVLETQGNRPAHINATGPENGVQPQSIPIVITSSATGRGMAE
jgi:hypothetical protein